MVTPANRIVNTMDSKHNNVIQRAQDALNKTVSKAEKKGMIKGAVAAIATAAAATAAKAAIGAVTKSKVKSEKKKLKQVIKMEQEQAQPYDPKPIDMQMVQKANVAGYLLSIADPWKYSGIRIPDSAAKVSATWRSQFRKVITPIALMNDAGTPVQVGTFLGVQQSPFSSNSYRLVTAATYAVATGEITVTWGSWQNVPNRTALATAARYCRTCSAGIKWIPSGPQIYRGMQLFINNASLVADVDTMTEVQESTFTQVTDTAAHKEISAVWKPFQMLGVPMVEDNGGLACPATEWMDPDQANTARIDTTTAMFAIGWTTGSTYEVAELDMVWNFEFVPFSSYTSNYGAKQVDDGGDFLSWARNRLGSFTGITFGALGFAASHLVSHLVGKGVDRAMQYFTGAQSAGGAGARFGTSLQVQKHEIATALGLGHRSPLRFDCDDEKEDIVTFTMRLLKELQASDQQTPQSVAPTISFGLRQPSLRRSIPLN